MAKVMVSLPDDLLRTIDIEAERRGTTRSGLLREWAEESLRRRTAHRVERMAQIDVRDGPIHRPPGRGVRPATGKRRQRSEAWRRYDDPRPTPCRRRPGRTTLTT